MRCVDLALDQVRNLNSEILESRRNICCESGFAFDYLTIAGFQNLSVIDVCLDSRTLVHHFQLVVLLRVVRKIDGTEFAPFGHAQRLFQRQTQCQASAFSTLKGEEVVVAIGVIAKDKAYHFVQSQRLDFGFHRGSHSTQDRRSERLGSST